MGFEIVEGDSIIYKPPLHLPLPVKHCDLEEDSMVSPPPKQIHQLPVKSDEESDEESVMSVIYDLHQLHLDGEVRKAARLQREEEDRRRIEADEEERLLLEVKQQEVAREEEESCLLPTFLLGGVAYVHYSHWGIWIELPFPWGEVAYFCLSYEGSWRELLFLWGELPIF